MLSAFECVVFFFFLFIYLFFPLTGICVSDIATGPTEQGYLGCCETVQEVWIVFFQPGSQTLLQSMCPLFCALGKAFLSCHQTCWHIIYMVRIFLTIKKHLKLPFLKPPQHVIHYFSAKQGQFFSDQIWVAIFLMTAVGSPRRLGTNVSMSHQSQWKLKDWG